MDCIYTHAAKLKLTTIVLLATVAFRSSILAADESATHLTIDWANGFLTIRGDFPGGKILVQYLEAYCRDGSTNRDWSETVIRHATEVIEVSDDKQRIRLRDRLEDGVVVEHKITAGAGEVDFRLVARNPTRTDSRAHWAQPCIRVDRFTGCPTDDARALTPEYARKCFVFLNGRLARLPTKPWAEEARYTPGQVYRPRGVDRNDVNPRPLSVLTPSSGLTGCFSEDEKWVMGVAWQPYQELFLGVVTCMHSDFRIGGLKAGETKKIRGKVYVVPANVPELVARYERDFPEQ